ncbi:hypothetical protein ACRS5I_27455 [Klebsiella pneumoniae]|uniref:hypothetical protein n=1 Tax=Klebsiella pneumoniae TaxID=573 RepID=UPI0029643D7D|nr:hypothetical protein [Klebsiella pneumoniae]MDW1283074.1 hypothetical protein [Klebsiella pneumoniae]
MGSCAAPSAKGDDKFITTDYLQQCPEQDKNKVLLQQLADRFKVERQAFIDAMVMTGVSRQDAEKRFLDYVKNKGRG